MKTLFALALGLGLAVGTVQLASAQLTFPQGSAEYPCDQSATRVESGDSEGHTVIATIKGIDRQRGILEVETKEGRVVMKTTPTETQSLQEGDKVQVCLEGDNLEGEDRLANPGR
jgi:hypothetical protein